MVELTCKKDCPFYANDVECSDGVTTLLGGQFFGCMLWRMYFDPLYDGYIKGNKWEVIEQQVYTFFKEHPVHSFKADAIAYHLSISVKDVERAISHLLALEIIDTRYRLGTEHLTKLIDDMTSDFR